MAWEPKESYGSLFKNDQKGNDKAPAYKGEIMLGGNVWELSGWVRPTKSGGTYLSLTGKVKAPAERKPDAPVTTKQELNQPKSGTAFDDFDNDPFPF